MAILNEKFKVTLLRAWKEIFANVDVNEGSNFFLLGGDSVKAVQLTSWLGQKGIALALMDIFTAPVLKDQIEKLKEVTPVGFEMPQNTQSAFAPPQTQQLYTPQMSPQLLELLFQQMRL